MKKEISIPAFVFKPIKKDTTTKETIKRQDDILEIEFPYFNQQEVLDIAKQLATKKRKAHDRPIDEVIDIINQVGDLWRNPSYIHRREALDVIPMTTGQSKSLCEYELYGTLELWKKQSAELELIAELGGKQFLDNWIPKGPIKVHAQPRGLVFHNLAGNAFNVGMLSIYFGLISKNVNLVKLPHEEPYFSVKLAESIMDVDKKIAQELAVIYWKGQESQIYDELFKSGNVDCVVAWGGLQSIEDIRRRAYQYGIKIIDHGPKMSFSIISEEVLDDINKMKELSQKITNDVAIWNQRACVSPRVIYIKEKPRMSAFESKHHQDKNEKPSEEDELITLFNKISKNETNGDSGSAFSDISLLMKRSAKMLRTEITDLSPLGFAKCLAESMEKTDQLLPRAHLTESDGMDTQKKREYFTMKYEFTKSGIVLLPPKDGMNWTVVYLRNPPDMEEIDKCQNRLVIVTRISNIKDLIHFMKKENLQHYLQTISVYGSDQFVEEVAEEFSLLGAARFPRVGEHNMVAIGSPWDGHYVIHDMVRWISIGFRSINDPSVFEMDSKK